MGEFLPLLLGCGVGVLVGPRPGSTRLKLAVLVCLGLGPLATWLNGELGDSGWLIAFDAAQVVAAFALTLAVSYRLMRRDVPRSGA
jgi:hypothetical protein